MIRCCNGIIPTLTHYNQYLMGYNHKVFNNEKQRRYMPKINAAIVQVMDKHRVVIPKELRELEHIEVGDKVLIEVSKVNDFNIGNWIKNKNEDIYNRLRSKCAGKGITVEDGVIEALDDWAKRKQ